MYDFPCGYRDEYMDESRGKKPLASAAMQEETGSWISIDIPGLDLVNVVRGKTTPALRLLILFINESTSA